MAISNMPDEQMRAALKELEQAIYNHDQWAETLGAVRSVVGIRRGAISGNMKVSVQAARSIG